MDRQFSPESTQNKVAELSIRGQRNTDKSKSKNQGLNDQHMHVGKFLANRMNNLWTPYESLEEESEEDKPRV